jgi:predicted Zn-dependent peptidase
MRRKIVICLMSFICCVHFLIAQNTGSSIISFKTRSDLSIMTNSVPGAKNSSISLVIRTGTVFEAEHWHGINAVLTRMLDQKVKAGIAGNKVLQSTIKSYSANANMAYTTYDFELTNNNIQPVMALMYDAICHTVLTGGELKKAVANVNEARRTEEANTDKQLQRTLFDLLYKFDYAKTRINGDSLLLEQLTVSDVDSFYRKYYAPNNAIFVHQGGVGLNELNSAVEKELIKWIKEEYNLDAIITKVISFKSNIYSSQRTIIHSDTSSVLTLAIQVGGVKGFQHATYLNYLICAMMKDTAEIMHRTIIKELEAKSLAVGYQLYNYTGIITIKVEPARERFAETYDSLRAILSRFYLTINPATIAVAKYELGKEMEEMLKSPQLINIEARFSSPNTDNYFTTLKDSVNSIGERELDRYTYSLFTLGNYAAVLETDTATYAAEQVQQWFDNVDYTMSEFNFWYEQNVPAIAGEENVRNLNRLKQWLTINPDLICQVNGFADKGGVQQVYG